MPYIGKSPTGSGVRQRYHFTATGGETSLSGADDNSKTLKFTDGEYVDVYLNGILLVQGTDYGVGTANTISSLAALSASDIVEVVVYDIYNVAKINSEAVRARHYYTATGGETSIGTSEISGLSFAANADIDVSLNGISLVAGTDYNTTTANTVGGLSALTAGQVVEIVIYEKFQLADTVSKASGGTFNGGVTFTSAATATGGLNVGTIKEATGTTTAMTIDSSGRILTPARPAFSGTHVNSAGNTGLTGDIIMNTEDFDIGGNYNSSTGVYVVPVTGIYRYSFSGFFSNSTGGNVAANTQSTVSLQTNASGSFDYYQGVTVNIISSTYYANASFSGLISATASDQLKITTLSGNYIFATNTANKVYNPRFSIELVG